MTQPSLKRSPKKKPNAWEWSPVDPRDVLETTKSGVVLLEGKPLSDQDVENLRAEVKALKTFRLWSIMDNTIRQRAIEVGFVKADNWEQTMSGKMMLYNLDVIKSIISVLEQANKPAALPIAPVVPKHVPRMR